MSDVSENGIITLRAQLSTEALKTKASTVRNNFVIILKNRERFTSNQANAESTKRQL